MGLFLSLALAAALVESKSTSAARIRVFISDMQTANDPIERAAGAPRPRSECLWVSITLAFFKAASGMPMAGGNEFLTDIWCLVGTGS